MWKKLYDFGRKYVDYKMGFYGAFVMGAVVFFINYENPSETTGAATAALKQGFYTFFLGGVFMKGCENLASKIKNRTWAITLAILIPSAITLLLTFQLHKFKGTPKPLASTMPTMVIIPATAVWAYKKRKEAELKTEDIHESVKHRK